MPRQATLFQSFAGGEYGQAPSWEVGYRLFRGRPLYRGVFTGRNVMRYIGGALGPRHEFLTATVPAPPAGSMNLKATGVNATDTGRFWALNDGAGPALTVYQSGGLTGPMTLTNIGTLTYTGGTQPANYSYLLLGTVTWLVSAIDKLYKIDHVAATVAAVAGSPRGRAICQYGDRTIIAGPDAIGVTPDPNQNRLYYSAPANPADWSGTWSGGPGAGLNYIDVGNASSAIIAVCPLRDQLAIVKADGTWWILTGVPGVNDTLRKVLNATAPAVSSAATTIAGGDAVGFLETSAASGGTHLVPAVFTGSAVSYRRDLDQTFAAGTPTVVLPLRRPGDWFYWGAVSSGTPVATQRDSFDATTGWTVVSGTCTLSVSTDHKEGTGAMQMANTGAVTISKAVGPWDLSTVTTFTMWIKQLAIGTGSMFLRFETSAGNYYQAGITTTQPSIVGSPFWGQKTLTRLTDFAATGAPNWANITAVTIATNVGARSYLFDDLESFAPGASGSLGVFRDGAWTRHTATFGAFSPLAGYDPQRDVVAVPKTDLSAVYILQPYADAADPSDGVVYYGDPPPPADVTFTLPEFVPFGDTEVALRGVYVDLVAYNGLAAGNVTFNVTCIPRRLLGTSTDPDTQTLSYSEAAPTGEAQRERRFLGFEELFGAGWQLQFSNIRGVAFERIVAVFDERQRQAA